MRWDEKSLLGFNNGVACLEYFNSAKLESEHDSYGRLMAHNLSFAWTQIKA